MPKQIINISLHRNSKNENWGFVVIGGKDQALTLKVGRIRPLGPAERAGLKPADFIWQINGKEVFEMTHGQCVNEIKKAGTILDLAVERGDHIVPHFEEIWPSLKKGKEKDPKKKLDYYLDAMQNGPQLSGFLPIPAVFTTVGKPQLFVNQYDNPIECYSEDVLEEMKEDRLTLQSPEYIKKMTEGGPVLPKPPKSDNPLAAQRLKTFDPTKSNAIKYLK